MKLVERVLAFFSRKLVEKRLGFYGMQWVQALVAFAIIGFLLWCAMQKYLFLTSVFPILSWWLGAALLMFALMLLLSVILSMLIKGNWITIRIFN